jgi:hypothetical protein
MPTLNSAARRPHRVRVLALVSALGLLAGVVLTARASLKDEVSSATPTPIPIPTAKVVPRAELHRGELPPDRTSAVVPSRADAGAQHEAWLPSLGLLAKTTLTDKEEHLLFEVGEGFVAACMRARGFQYIPNHYSIDEERAARAKEAIRNPSDVVNARKHGYGIADSLQSVETPFPDPNKEAIEKMPPAEQEAWSEALAGHPAESTATTTQAGIGTLYGSGEVTVQWDRGSCLAQSRRELFGDDMKHAQMVMTLNGVRADQIAYAEANPGYRAGIERWRACMTKRGLSYGEPGAAVEDLTEAFHNGQLGFDELRAREVEVASGDASCYLEVGLESLLRDALARAEAEIERESRVDLESVVAVQTEALERARREFRE